jgi:hypothetical protein
MPARQSIDATRTVEKIGLAIIRIKTDHGREGIGVTYHEVGGKAVRNANRRTLA